MCNQSMKSIVLLLIGLVASFSSHAVTGNPVEWSARTNMDSGTHGHVTLTAHIEDGWHLYATELPDGGPNPTSFSFETTPGIRLNGGVTTQSIETEGVDMIFHLKLKWWEGDVSFVQYFEIVNDRPNSIDVNITYQASNGTTCIAPTTQSFVLSVEPINALSGATESNEETAAASDRKHVAESGSEDGSNNSRLTDDSNNTENAISLAAMKDAIATSGIVSSVVAALLLVMGLFLLGAVKLRYSSRSEGVSVKRLFAGTLFVILAFYVLGMSADRCGRQVSDNERIENVK